ncbi:MG2 domain-containing protein [Winogradskyella sp.]|uniref:MG2 domain-containing protein n=1 Tax=Winogradskyella sp. TaxID=1883156 RepID=UPI0026393AFE|nr:MG2 domain-containing protein [Winogradskyella sp.]
MNYRTFTNYLFLLSTLFLLGQDGTSLLLQENHDFSLPTEDIYIQTDREIYEFSETIWFKAYILESRSNIPSQKNQTLYVQLRHKESKEVVYKGKYKIESGISNGSLFLEESLNSGRYTIEAYTSSSIHHDSFPVTSFKTILIRSQEAKVLMDADFDKPNYISGNDVKVNLNFYNNKGSNFEFEKVLIKHYRGTKVIGSNVLETDTNGDIKLYINKDYVKPEIKTTLSLKSIKDQEIDLNIPYKSEKQVYIDIFPEGGKLIQGINNKVAFKATDEKGYPVDINAEVIENETSILSFSSYHHGMGFFNIQPKANYNYKLRVTHPVERTIDVSKIEPKGIGLSLIENKDKFLKVKIENSGLILPINVTLAIQSKGIPYWQGEVNLNKDIIIVKIPKSDLPKRLVELTLYNENQLPIAERLIFLGNDSDLKIKRLSALEDTYKPKDKIELKFKVQNHSGKSPKANLSLRVYDNAFYEPDFYTDIVVHQYLFSNLKGRIYKPFYYFDEANKHRFSHLDLLLLTHGWRSYNYSKESLYSIKRLSNNKLEDSQKVMIYEYGDDKKLKKITSPMSARLVYPSKVLDYQIGIDGIIYPPLTENEMIYIKAIGIKEYRFKAVDAFEKIAIINKDKELKPSIFLNEKIVKRNKNDLLRYVSENNVFLDEVEVKGSKKRAANIDKWKRKRVYPGQGDYVCYQYNVLNCVNHTNGGYEPVEGEMYGLNGGRSIVYRVSKKEDTKKRIDKFGYIDGYELKKEYYMPNYAIEPTDLLDLRTTLVWEPNLVPDENGYINYTFYTSDIRSSFSVHLEGVDRQGNLGSVNYKFRVK